MKTTTVPAQVTTVEDRFAGNLSLSQLLLLVCPVFISCLVYVVFPPFIKLSIFKVCLSALIFLVFTIMSIRIKGKIILMWLLLVLKYRQRPRYYLFNKNDLNLRVLVVEEPEEVNVVKTRVVEDAEPQPSIKLATPDLVRLELAIADPRSNFNFKTNKNGVLSVHITEIQ